MIRLWKLRSFKMWWFTRHCKHKGYAQRSQLIEAGRKKMFWCTDCQRTWFS